MSSRLVLGREEQDRARVAPWISADGAEWGVQDWWPENAYANGLGLARIFGSLWTLNEQLPY